MKHPIVRLSNDVIIDVRELACAFPVRTEQLISPFKHFDCYFTVTLRSGAQHKIGWFSIDESNVPKYLEEIEKDYETVVELWQSLSNI